MGKLATSLILALTFLMAACGDDAPAGNGTIIIDSLAGNQDTHLPAIDGTKINFSNFLILPSTSDLSFVFGISAGGIRSQDSTDFDGATLVLRVSQTETREYNFLISKDASENLGANFANPISSIYENFNRNAAATFEILYNGVELVHGQIRY